MKMRSHRKAKTGLNLEHAMYRRCTAGIGMTGIQALGTVDESRGIKAYVDHSREHNSQSSDLILRRFQKWFDTSGIFPTSRFVGIYHGIDV